ncbi:hypothetical protein H3O04_31400 [Burkholderia sp. KCJ3K979]|uniref:hypothetical protein n=1 Tax=Burkholderia sp. KCJ3K979 TaxID=2759149 RepID=UPI001929C26E|nr:hypothetical protein [Burkholderia sp. KCJ3K979]MBL3966983.1 hypothetical protein [Burkholderia sp. KCJ3K979]
MTRIFVVDMNVLQSSQLAGLLSTDVEAQFVLPDTAFVEMSKHEEWELTMSRALAVFAGHTSRLSISLSTGEILRNELSSLVSSDSSALLSAELKAFAADLIEEFAHGRKENARLLVESKFDEVRQKLIAEELNAVRAKQQTHESLVKWKATLKAEVVSAIRKPNADHTFFLSFVQLNAQIFCEDFLESEGVKAADAVAFIEKKPMILRYFYALTRHILLALKNGGDISSMKAEKELNNQLDLDYVLIATYFNGLHTSDKDAQAAYRDITEILATPMQVAHQRVNQGLRDLGLLA